jgi:hypothetical protein
MSFLDKEVCVINPFIYKLGHGSFLGFSWGLLYKQGRSQLAGEGQSVTYGGIVSNVASVPITKMCCSVSR